MRRLLFDYVAAGLDDPGFQLKVSQFLMKSRCALKPTKDHFLN